MSALKLAQFQVLLASAEVKSSIFLPEVREAIRFFREKQKGKVTDHEEALGQIYDEADDFAGRTRKQYELAQQEGGTPNEARTQRMRASNTSKTTREDAEAVYFYFQYGIEDSGFADAISAKLFDGKTFPHYFQAGLRKLRVDVPQTHDGLDSFRFGCISILLNEASDGRPLGIPPSNRAALFDGDQLIPSEALRWHNLVSEMVGRDAESEELFKWADDGQLRAKVHVLHGPGGVGKTRLAASLADRLPDWRVGFLPPDINSPDLSVAFRGSGTGTLIIIDYPEERPRLVDALFKALSMRQNYTIPVRFLLVSREGEAAWRNFPGASALNFTTTPLEVKGSLTEADAMKVVASVVVYFADDPRTPDIDIERAAKWLSEDATHRKPLFTLAATIHALSSPERAFSLSGQALLEALADIELARIRRFSARNFPTTLGTGQSNVLERLVALALFHEKGISKRTLYALGEQNIAPGATGHDLLERAVYTPFWTASDAEQDEGYLEKPAPDILGAAILHAVFLRRETPQEFTSWLGCVAQATGEAFLGILARLSFDLIYVDPQASRQLETTATNMLDVQSGLYPTFENLMYLKASVFSAEFQRKLLANALNNCPDGETEKRAVLANNLANVLSSLGRREQALSAAQEAVNLYQKLDEAQPEAFLPNLPGSLNNLANMLSALGHREEALSAAQEAIDLYRRLAEVGPEAVLPNLATSLNNLANRLSELGRREEALSAVQEAVELRRRLAEARPEAFLPNLATSLNNLANRLSELGRREEALSAVQEAVELRRRLAEARPEAFLPNLPGSLSNLATILSDLGRREEALSAVQEAVDLYRRLAEARPEAFLPDLSGSLSNLATILSTLGRREEALGAAQEAVDLDRRLFAARPQAFQSGLAMSLRNLVGRLFDLGHREEALRAAREAVDLYRSLVAARPEAFLPDLSGSLSNLANILSDLGRREEALSAAQEAVDLDRRLVAARPEAFSPNLATSLNNLANILSDLGHREKALSVSQEAIELRRRLAEDLPEAFLPSLATSLNNLANMLSDLGRRDEALGAAKEAVASLRPFFLALPPAHAGRMAVMVGVYLGLCEELDVKPDMELLQSIPEKLEGLQGGDCEAPPK